METQTANAKGLRTRLSAMEQQQIAVENAATFYSSADEEYTKMLVKTERPDEDVAVEEPNALDEFIQMYVTGRFNFIEIDR